MAYNPFNIFRRNQKAIFAVVTVVIMFMFVLSSGMTGKADFFNWLPEWVRGKTKTGDALCSIDGDRVFPRDIEALRFQRVVANKFLMYASREAANNIQKSLIELQAKATPNLVQRLQLIREFEQQGRLPQGSYAAEVQNILASPDSKPADKEMIRSMRVMSDFMQAQQRYATLGSYLTAVPNRSDRDLIEFMLWEKKAKQLGIDFTEVEVKKSLIQKEFLGQLLNDSEIRRVLREEYRDRYSDDLCFTAIAAEFRVRSARSAIMGLNDRSDHTLNAPIINSVPYELFDFYRDKTSPTSYQALRVPVEAFIPLVTETPSDNELQRLFNDRQAYEPDPAKEEAGFREPRKVKIEWISVTGDEPYYKKLASEWQSRTELLAKSEVRGLIVPFPGTGIAAVFHIAAPAALKEPLVHEKYERDVVKRHEGRISFGWSGLTSFVNSTDVLETSTVQPQNLVAAAGGAAGGIGLGNILNPATMLYSASVAADQKARIKACMPLFLGSVPGPSMLATMIGGEVEFRKSLPPALPLAAYKPLILKELSEGKARELAVNDLKKLKENIDKLTETGKARETAAKDLIAEFIKTRGVKSGSSTEFHGEFTIGDDPGLAPLKTVLDKEKNPHAMLSASSPVNFGRTFFWKSDPRGGSRETATGNYLPEFYPERAAENAIGPFAKMDPVYLAWRTAEQVARGSSFTEAKPRVIEAWKRMKARELAKAEAERLANELRNKPGESEFLTMQNMNDMQLQLQAKTMDPKAKSLVKNFQIDNVAPFQIALDPTSMSSGGGGGETVRSFGLAPTTDIPYPTVEMTKQLLAERTKPKPTTFVLIDQPKDSYYVVALLNRKERSPEEFRAHVYGTLQRSKVGTQIAGEQMQVSFGKARDSILALLKKEFKFEETEEQKKRLDDRQKSSFE